MLRFFLKFFLMFTFFLTFSSAQNRAIIIFDASGSMWGQINGVPKITIAKDALKSVVKGWNENSELGLMAYGHRRKGDCSDIQTLVPTAKIDKNRIINAVMNISPKGKTPISRSLKKAANELKYTEDRATVILISDGKETCDPNPCGTAKALKKQGIDFVAHVIGFNVDRRTDKELECIAKATGGEYFSAKNANELNKAVKEVAKKTQKPTPPPQPKALKYNLKITASEAEGKPNIKAFSYIYKYSGDEDEPKGEQMTTCTVYKDKGCKKKLPVGKYLIEISYKDLKKQTLTEVKPQETIKVHIILKKEEPTKEDLIKADSVEPQAKSNEQKAKESVTKEKPIVTKDETKQLQEGLEKAKNLINALGSAVGKNRE